MIDPSAAPPAWLSTVQRYRLGEGFLLFDADANGPYVKWVDLVAACPPPSLRRVAQAAVDTVLGKGPTQEGGWQPIATAPKDGTEVVALVNGRPYLVNWPTHWTQHAEPWWRDREGYGLFEPTHWMPLPAPPAACPPPSAARCDCGAVVTMCADCAVADYQSAQRDCVVCCPLVASPAPPGGEP